MGRGSGVGCDSGVGHGSGVIPVGESTSVVGGGGGEEEEGGSSSSDGVDLRTCTETSWIDPSLLATTG